MTAFASILAGCSASMALFWASSGRLSLMTGGSESGRLWAWAGRICRRLRMLLRKPPAPHLWEEVFYAVAFHLKAGEALPQAFRAVAEEGSGHPYDSLRRAVRSYEAGSSMLQSLQSASEGSYEFRRLAEAVEMGLSAGSDVPLLLCHTAENLAKRRSLQKEAKAKMAESRLTAVILSAMPWLIGAITYRYDPSLMLGALSGPRGRMVLACSLGLWLAGNVAICLALASVTKERRG